MKSLSEYLNESLNEALGYDAAERALIKDLKERNKDRHLDISDDDILDITNKLMEYYSDNDMLHDSSNVDKFVKKVALDIKNDDDNWVSDKLPDYDDMLRELFK